jgi:alpha-galactosidase
MPRCWNKVRYEVMDHLGFFCAESSEHLAEYVLWFVKDGREDLIEEFAIPLDEYPLRCVEQAEGWAAQAAAPKAAASIEVVKSHEFAAEMMNAVVTDTPYVAYANLPNHGQVPQLPLGAAVETPALVDGNGVQANVVTDIPPHLVAMMRSQINVQELVVRAMIEDDLSHVYHAAYMDPHTAAELDLRLIPSPVTDLLAEPGDMLPDFAPTRRAA